MMGTFDYPSKKIPDFRSQFEALVESGLEAWVESGWSGFFGQKKVFLELFGSWVQEVTSR
jgi:hypothetical protein